MALPVSNLVRVSINLSPLAAARRSFGVLLVAGDSNVINGKERVRTYLTSEGVALDFGVNAPEYKAAQLYFNQVPKPNRIMIGRWLRTASAAINIGGVLTPAEQLLSNFTGITNGALNISIDGVAKTLSALDFSAAVNLNGVASIIDGALTGGDVVWTGTHFEVTSSTTGISSTVSYATTATGTDLGPILKLTAATSQGLVEGYAAETPAQCAAAMANFSAAWYGLSFAASVQPVDAENLAVAAVIESLNLKRMFGVTITNTNVLSSMVTNDLASELKAGGYKQTFCQYSSSSPYAIASAFGRGFSVNFAANKSTITLMYKQEPGVAGENLTEAQATTLKFKRCNVFVNYVNDTTIIQYGMMSGPAWFDEIHGLDWFQDAVQNSCYNVLYQSKNKVPQTDAGANQLTTAIQGACDEAVFNGLVAPGVWNAAGFGQLEMGQYLKSGYYIYAQPMALQSQADREARIAPPFQVAIKLAGAIQELDVLVDVNR